MKTCNLVLPLQRLSITERPHATLSGSQAERFMTCPGSVMLLKNITGTKKSSAAAEEGTFAHEVAEYLFRRQAGEPVDVPAIPAEYDQNMLTYCNAYVERVMAFSGVTHIEVPLDFSALHKDLGGTSDAVNIDFNTRTLRVIDLKFGRSVVDAQDNAQLLTYAVGAVHTFKLFDQIDLVELHILMPRGKNSSATVTMSELLAFEVKLIEAAALTKDAFAPLKMSTKGCFWCAAKVICPEFEAKAKAIMLSDFNVPAPKAKQPSTIEPSRFLEVLTIAKQLAPWCDAVFQQAKDMLATDSEALPGWKLRPGRTMKSWTNDVEVVTTVLNATNELQAEEKLAIRNALISQPQPLDVNTLCAKLGDFQANAGWSCAADTAISVIETRLQDMIIQKQAASSLAPVK